MSEQVELTSIQLIETERLRQIIEEGYDSDHDDHHTSGELAMAACCYAMPERLYRKGIAPGGGHVFCDPWPFYPIQSSSRCYNDHDRRKKFSRGNYPLGPEEMTIDQKEDLLIKADAFILAELDRIRRIKKLTLNEASN